MRVTTKWVGIWVFNLMRMFKSCCSCINWSHAISSADMGNLNRKILLSPSPHYLSLHISIKASQTLKHFTYPNSSPFCNVYPPICMATRSGNTTAHLGLVDVVGKRSWEDGKTRNDLAKEKKQAKEEKQKATICKLPVSKKCMAEVNASTSHRSLKAWTNISYSIPTACYETSENK